MGESESTSYCFKGSWDLKLMCSYSTFGYAWVLLISVILWPMFIAEVFLADREEYTEYYKWKVEPLNYWAIQGVSYAFSNLSVLLKLYHFRMRAVRDGF